MDDAVEGGAGGDGLQGGQVLGRNVGEQAELAQLAEQLLGGQLARVLRLDLVDHQLQLVVGHRRHQGLEKKKVQIQIWGPEIKSQNFSKKTNKQRNTEEK